jgi:phage terminase small subunit
VKPEYDLFVANYLENENATQAAISAGWSPKSAHKQGSRLLKRLDIQGAIAQARSKNGKKFETQVAKAENLADKVIAEISKIAFGNLQDCFHPETGELLPISQLPREVAATLTAFEDNKGFKKIKTGSKMSALELLAKITQILKQEQTSQQAVQIIVSPAPALPERQDTALLRPDWGD